MFLLSRMGRESATLTKPYCGHPFPQRRRTNPMKHAKYPPRAHAVPLPAPASRHGSSPLACLLLGAVLVLFWLLASLLQIQTSEAFILHGPVVSFVPNWGIVHQPVDLVGGSLSPDLAKAVMWGYGIELIYLVCVVGYEVAHESVKASNQHLASVFRTGAIALIAFDAYTDFQYGSLASGFWGQVAFALVTAFIVAFFGVIGVRLIEHGLSEWSR